jgi:hypothetical protein
MYFYASPLTPAFSSAAPPQGSTSLASITSGGNLTLNGTRLSASTSDYSITLGGVPCPAISADVDGSGRGLVTCDLPALPAGVRVLRVLVAGRGFAMMPPAPAAALLPAPQPWELPVAHAVRLASLAPARGSFWGGSLINITGFGLAPTNESGAPAAPGAAVTAASISGATPAGAPLAVALVSASAAGWAVVSVGRLTTAKATPSTFQLTIQLKVVDPATNTTLGAGTIAYTLDKAYAPVVSAANTTATANGTRRVALSWRVQQGTGSAAAGGGGGAPWAAPAGAGAASTAGVTFQAGSGGGAAVAGPLFKCGGATVLNSTLNATSYSEVLQCDLPVDLPAANYTAWGAYCRRAGLLGLCRRFCMLC